MDHAFKKHFVILVRLNKQYVDKINVAVDEVLWGTCYKNGQLVVKEEAVNGDLLILLIIRVPWK